MNLSEFACTTEGDPRFNQDGSLKLDMAKCFDTALLTTKTNNDLIFGLPKPTEYRIHGTQDPQGPTIVFPVKGDIVRFDYQGECIFRIDKDRVAHCEVEANDENTKKFLELLKKLKDTYFA